MKKTDRCVPAIFLPRPENPWDGKAVAAEAAEAVLRQKNGEEKGI